MLLTTSGRRLTPPNGRVRRPAPQSNEEFTKLFSNSLVLVNSNRKHRVKKMSIRNSETLRVSG